MTIESAVRPKPVKFSSRGAAVLSEGHWSKALAMSDNLWVRVKVYASGGENGLHAHATEDHAFFVLQGSAVFNNSDGDDIPVRAFEGVMVPKGAFYRFASSGEENLVMLRVGASDWDDSRDREEEARTLRPSKSGGSYLPSGGVRDPDNIEENHTGAIPGVIVPGQFFDPA
jgi:mannose-6-phosphate isomerase-like protein (cupin superfamily)